MPYAGFFGRVGNHRNKQYYIQPRGWKRKERERERKLDCFKCLKPRFGHKSYKKMQDYSTEMDSSLPAVRLQQKRTAHQATF